MMRTMKLTFGGKTFLALVDMENHTIFSADIWHTYNKICYCYKECFGETPPKYNFHDYVDEVLSNGRSETFEYYKPWKNDCYQLLSDYEENTTGESWTFFVDNIQWYSEDDFFEQLHHLINQCYLKAEAADKKNAKKVEKIV